jgi:hypothetical protein
MYCTKPYNGYVGSYDWSKEDNCAHGKVLYITDLISYEAADYDGIQASFEAAVDHYLDVCAEIGDTPNNPIPEGYLKIEDAPTDGTVIWVVRPSDQQLFEAWFYPEGCSLVDSTLKHTGTWHCEVGGWFEEGELHYWLPNDEPTSAYLVTWQESDGEYQRLYDDEGNIYEHYRDDDFKSVGLTAVFPNN